MIITNEDILKNNVLPVVENAISKALIEAIPTTIDERRAFIQSAIGKVEGCIFSQSLQEYVAISPKSVEEIASHASKSVLSTIVALNYLPLIENAAIVAKGLPPHSNKEKKVFHFKEIILLAAMLKGYGHAKITVGKQSLGKHLVYCLTGLEIEKTPIESTPLTGPKQ